VGMCFHILQHCFTSILDIGWYKKEKTARQLITDPSGENISWELHQRNKPIRPLP